MRRERWAQIRWRVHNLFQTTHSINTNSKKAPIRRLAELKLIEGYRWHEDFVLQKSGSTRTNSASTRSASPTSCLWPGRGFCKDFPPSGGPGKSESQDCEDISFLKNALQKVQSSIEWCALETQDPGISWKRKPKIQQPSEWLDQVSTPVGGSTFRDIFLDIFETWETAIG